MRTNRRTPIAWKNPPSAREELRPHPYVAAPNLPPEAVDTYMTHLLPGGLFVTRWSLWRDRRWDRPDARRHEHSYLHHDPHTDALWRSGGSPAYAPALPGGTLALYAGAVRVEETSRGGRDTARFVRHTFIVGASRWMAWDLGDFVPVTS